MEPGELPRPARENAPGCPINLVEIDAELQAKVRAAAK
jgi:hypothetical protein